jgi:hypothetical protein
VAASRSSARDPRTIAPVKIAIALCVLAGCGGKRDEPHLLAVRGGRLIQIAPESGTAHEVKSAIDGNVVNALAVDRGRAVIAAVAAEQAEVWRLEVDPFAATRVWKGSGPVLLDGASADGRVVAIGFGKILDGDRVEDLKPPVAARTWSGDVSPDGRRVLISFAPKCEGSTIHTCKFEVWGYDRDRPERGWRTVAAPATSAYNPRFAPSGEVAVHVVQADPKCPGKPFGCRDVEDTVLVPFDGGDPKPLREGAWTPRYSGDGSWIALADPQAKRLLVGPVDGELTSIAENARFAGAWSFDGRWLAYTREDATLGVMRRDGGDRRKVGDGREVGWIAGALPQGKVSEPTPTVADREHADVEKLVRTYRRLKRGDEPLHWLAPPNELQFEVKRIATPDDLDRLLQGDARVLAIVATSALCERRHLAVIEAAASHALVTNRLEGEPDENPLRKLFVAASARTRLDAKFDDAVELVGVDLPERVRAEETFAMTLHYRVLRRPTRAWRTFVHFDAGSRFQGDHSPHCAPSHWRPGDTITDRFEVVAGRMPGSYAVWTGFAADSRNVKVTSGAHEQDRVQVGRIVVD